jgi:hypothetical protein
MARAELKTFKKALRTDVGGTIGVRKMKTGNMLPGGIRKMVQKLQEKNTKPKRLTKNNTNKLVSKARKKGSKTLKEAKIKYILSLFTVAQQNQHGKQRLA